jgi:ABC-type cobalamin/Fe3+-siderophores transport system ATPase subunit
VQTLTNRVLIFIGPPGSGKNTLIDCYCRQHDIQLVRYKEEKEKILLDTFQYNDKVPEDLDNLIEFIKSNSKTTKAAYFKTKSAFSGFSTNKKSPQEIKKFLQEE